MIRSGQIFWWLFILVSIALMVRLSTPYLAFEPGIDFLRTKLREYHWLSWRLSFYTHVLSSVFVLLAGFTQFNKRWLHKKIHRSMGKMYVLIVLLFSAPSAFVMAMHANGGITARASFVCLSLTWFFSTLMAYIKVRQHQYAHHTQWMLISFALTLSAITFRFYMMLVGLAGFHWRPYEVYGMIAWLSWVPNLIVAMALIIRKWPERWLDQSV